MHVFIPNSCVLNSAILLCPTLTLVSLPEHMARDGKFSSPSDTAVVGVIEGKCASVRVCVFALSRALVCSCLLSDASEPSHLNLVISAWLQTNIKADNQTHADMDIVDRASIAVCLMCLVYCDRDRCREFEEL